MTTQATLAAPLAVGTVLYRITKPAVFAAIAVIPTMMQPVTALARQPGADWSRLLLFLPILNAFSAARKEKVACALT